METSLSTHETVLSLCCAVLPRFLVQFLLLGLPVKASSHSPSEFANSDLHHTVFHGMTSPIEGREDSVTLRKSRGTYFFFNAVDLTWFAMGPQLFQKLLKKWLDLSIPMLLQLYRNYAVCLIHTNFFAI